MSPQEIADVTDTILGKLFFLTRPQFVLNTRRVASGDDRFITIFQFASLKWQIIYIHRGSGKAAEFNGSDRVSFEAKLRELAAPVAWEPAEDMPGRLTRGSMPNPYPTKPQATEEPEDL